MSKNLVLVESPAKAKTINKYLGRDYIVEATVGHLRNLPKTKLGVEIENDFLPQFVTIRGKGDIIKKIKTLASKSKKIYIATDPDREGEAIAQDIAEILNGNSSTKLYRVLFNEITRHGIEKAMKQPREIDSYLVNSQRARRVMDRIIGYKISPFLWKSVIELSGSGSLSAGRVQSVALRLICEREDEIEKFISVEYWSIWAVFETDRGEIFKAKLFKINGKDIKVKPSEMDEEQLSEFLEKYILIQNENSAVKIFEDIRSKKEFIISSIVKRKTKRNPPPPFITSTMQAEASSRLRMRPKETMGIAQKLYEGIDLGSEGTVGLITYMRTDSTRISDDIRSEAKEYITSHYGKQFYPDVPNNYEKKKTSNVQDAHEAIRPTSLKYTPDFVKKYLDKKSFKVYELIWKRFIASQMSQALAETTVVEISADQYLFKALGSAILFPGFLQVYDDFVETPLEADEKGEYRNSLIPAGMEKGNKLGLNDLQKTQHFTKPPPRYTESSLIKDLESRGIGRPSTYSMIVSTIQERKYVEMTDRKIFPTILGRGVNTILVKNFPDIINVHFTANMESELDQIAQGDNNYVNVLNDFYGPFSHALKHVEKNIEKIKCDLCGSDMDIKVGRFGKFLACTNYPECKNIKSLKEIAANNQEPEYTGEKCEKCGSRTLYRTGKFGRFIGCEKYPDCDYIKNISFGVSCPKCKEGDIVERKSRRGKSFYGCSRYPDCDYVSWYKPVPEKCPNKDSEFMEERYSKKKGVYLKCPVCSEELVPEEENEK
jgi:DNA topoisomerase I